MNITDTLKKGLIVSCQADEQDPLYGPAFMVAMAQSAKIGGAVGIRANGINDIKAIKKSLDLPIIGIYKKKYSDSEVYITPTLDEVKAVIDAGAAIIALDATNRTRPGNISLSQIVDFIKSKYALPIMADISTLEEGINAFNIGFDIVATTLSGYTPYSPQSEGPDYELLENLTATVTVPVIMEGKISSPEQAFKALQLGAHAVVIGSAITRPQLITKSYVTAMQK